MGDSSGPSLIRVNLQNQHWAPHSVLWKPFAASLSVRSATGVTATKEEFNFNGYRDKD